MDDLDRLRDQLDSLAEKRVPERVGPGAVEMAFRCIAETKATVGNIGVLLLQHEEKIDGQAEWLDDLGRRVIRLEKGRATRAGPIKGQTISEAEDEEKQFVQQATMVWRITKAVAKGIATLMVGAAFLLGFLEGIFELSSRIGTG